MAREMTSGRLRGVFRSIRPPATDSAELDNPKIAAAAALLVVLVPLLPFLVVGWMISKTLQGVERRVSWE
jgi:hypothetical protein